ncbi:ankyrin repeat-containing protein ITN1-like [Quercus lobata]|uniref:ankyrin repeat-containing protein ITN1-like n=1 Tax=Quercus lobata TaxID=97700 RepID=UPI0012449C41|nr:ankyrin repeat-containing protein ITN1-like [Quercus lobata]
MVRDPITEGGDTALHIAAATNHPNFVRELLKLMKKEELEIKNKYGQTALYLAAASGNVIIAEEMVEKNNKLTLTHIESGKRKFTPLHIAALLGHREMVSFLFAETSFEYLSPEERIELLVATISNDLFDIALRIMKMDVQLAIAKDIYGKTALYELARKPFAIGSKSQLSVSKRCLYSYKSGLEYTGGISSSGNITKEVKFIKAKKSVEVGLTAEKPKIEEKRNVEKQQMVNNPRN